MRFLIFVLMVSIVTAINPQLDQTSYMVLPSMQPQVSYQLTNGARYVVPAPMVNSAANTLRGRSNSDDLIQMMKMQLMMNMQTNQQMTQMQNTQYQQWIMNQNQVKAGSRRKSNILKRMTTQGKVNNGLLLMGIANEFANKDNKYFDKKKGRIGVGAGLILNNVFR